MEELVDVLGGGEGVVFVGDGGFEGGGGAAVLEGGVDVGGVEVAMEEAGDEGVASGLAVAHANMDAA